MLRNTSQWLILVANAMVTMRNRTTFTSMTIIGVILVIGLMLTLSNLVHYCDHYFVFSMAILRLAVTPAVMTMRSSLDMSASSGRSCTCGYIGFYGYNGYSDYYGSLGTCL